MNVWLLSDLHLKSDQEPSSKILVHFLNQITSTANPQDILILLGDIFDLWVGGHSVFYLKYKNVVDAIQALKSKGVRIIFIEGNHDLHIEPFWKDQLGAEVYVEAHYLELNGLTLRLEHGDEINLEDLAYLRLRSFLRHPILKFLGHHLPGSFWSYLGRKASQTSRKVSEKSRRQEGQDQKMIQMIRDHAIRAYIEKPFDVIVSGHMHVQDDWKTEIVGSNIHRQENNKTEKQSKDNQNKENQKNEIRSLNLGSWLSGSYPVFHIEKLDAEWKMKWIYLNRNL